MHTFLLNNIFSFIKDFKLGLFLVEDQNKFDTSINYFIQLSNNFCFI